MLHESSHVRNNDVRNHKIVELSTLGALMALSYYYQPKDLLANTVFITISIVTKELAYLAHSRYVEMRADTFANKHATFNQLTQAHKFFLSISDNSKNYMMLKTHPLSIQRALAIENELALRKKSMNNHAVLQLCDKHSS
jgi:Zn-dependent protease with chaperone function